MFQIDARVISNDTVCGGYMMARFDAAEIAGSARPGQFVEVRVPGLDECSLRRPFSVCDCVDGILTVLYKRVGRGTELLAGISAGSPVNLLGPLGNGFPVPDRGAFPLLVGGGYGVAPLLFLAKTAPECGAVFIGGRSSCDVLLAGEFEKIGWAVHICTDDGSLGLKGQVTRAVDRWLDSHAGVKVEFFGCGPAPMLRAVDERAYARGAEAWLSLDRRMACGVGACLGCVQKVRSVRSDSNSAVILKSVCKDGPVFGSGEVVWEDA